ncbi:hypothetical protein FQZ97_816240 [compost metagenome]
MLAVAHQISVNVIIPHTDLRRLVALAHHMKPPVPHAIAADVAHGRRPVVPPDQVGYPQVHREQCGDNEQRALVERILRGHQLGCFDHVAPLQMGQRARSDIHRIALLVDRFLLHGAERIDLGQPLIDGVLEKAAAHSKYLAHRALGHAVNARGKGSCGFRGDFALTL